MEQGVHRMPGDENEEEYELLSHDEVERLRDEAHEGQGDFTEAVHEIRHVQDSIDDFTELLASVKNNILEDYAQSPNPEAKLETVEEQNKKLAEALINVTKKVEDIAANQEKILDQIAQAQQDINDIDVEPSGDVYGQNQPDTPDLETSEDAEVDDLLEDMPGDETDVPGTEEDDGFFNNILGS